MGEDQKFINIFISESLEQLQSISDDLLELEKDPSDEELINNLFRNLHTLKGAASLDGLEKISSLAHIMEDIFGVFRDKDASLDSEMLDCVFEGVDILQFLVESVNTSKYDAIETQAVYSDLKELFNDIAPNHTVKPDKTIEKKDADRFDISNDDKDNILFLLKEKTAYLITLNFLPEDAMKYIMGFIVINNLKPKSDYIHSNPTADQIKDKAVNFNKIEILCLSDKDMHFLEGIIKVNCKDYSINSLKEKEVKDLININSHTEQSKKEDDKLNISNNDKDRIFSLIKEELAYTISLHFIPEDAMKYIMGYIIINNLKSKCEYLHSTPTTEQIKDKSIDFDKIEILCLSDNERNTLDEIIKINCKDYTINLIEEEELKQLINGKAKAVEKVEIKPEEKVNEKSEVPITKKLEKVEEHKTESTSAYMEVDKSVLNGVIENIGELVMNLNVSSQLLSDICEEKTDSIEEFKTSLQAVHMQFIQTKILGDALMDLAVLLRLVPLKMVLRKLPRIVRDAARKIGKNISFIIQGENTRVAQEILDVLEAPLLHLLRNSVDHGIETSEERKLAGKSDKGIVNLRSYQDRDKVIIEISDDGKGLDKEKILQKAVSRNIISVDDAKSISDEEAYKLIFQAGFSTKEAVSQMSGRGVGMDVVLHDISSVGGKVDLFSEKGKGTNIVLTLPIFL